MLQTPHMHSLVRIPAEHLQHFVTVAVIAAHAHVAVRVHVPDGHIIASIGGAEALFEGPLHAAHAAELVVEPNTTQEVSLFISLKHALQYRASWSRKNQQSRCSAGGYESAKVRRRVHHRRRGIGLQQSIVALHDRQ